MVRTLVNRISIKPGYLDYHIYEDGYFSNLGPVFTLAQFKRIPMAREEAENTGIGEIPPINRRSSANLQTRNRSSEVINEFL